MPTLTYDYVYFATGPHERQPTRTPSGPGGFTLIKSQPGGSYATGDSITLGELPATQTVNGVSYPFAFVNVSGGTPAGQYSFDPNTPPPAVVVGTAPVVALVVYAPTGGGVGGSGATIDSFDTTTGSLFNDTFVKVAPDTSGALTTSGNVEGYVSTASAETITALSPTSPTNVQFIDWLTLPNTVSSTTALAVAKGTSLSALAFYRTPPVVPPPPVDPCTTAANSLRQIINEGDRPRLTVAMFAAIKAQLEKCVQEGKLSASEVNTLLNDYTTTLNEPTPPLPGPPKV